VLLYTLPKLIVQYIFLDNKDTLDIQGYYEAPKYPDLIINDMDFNNNFMVLSGTSTG